MKNKPQADDEILAEMEEIDRLELEGGISAAPANKRTDPDLKDKPKYKMSGLSKDGLKLK
jgi:hypothetical protein